MPDIIVRSKVESEHLHLQLQSFDLHRHEARHILGWAHLHTNKLSKSEFLPFPLQALKNPAPLPHSAQNHKPPGVHHCWTWWVMQSLQFVCFIVWSTGSKHREFRVSPCRILRLVPPPPPLSNSRQGPWHPLLDWLAVTCLLSFLERASQATSPTWNRRSLVWNKTWSKPCSGA